MVLYVEQRSTKFFPLCNLSHSIGYMSQTGLCCFRHPSSCSTPRCLFLLVSLVIAPCSTCFLVQSLEKWLMGVQWVQCVCVCLCAGVFWCVRVKVHIFMFLKVCARVCVCMCPSVCTAMSLGCVIEMEMSQSATAMVCHPALHSLQNSSSPKLYFFTLYLFALRQVCA